MRLTGCALVTVVQSGSRPCYIVLPLRFLRAEPAGVIFGARRKEGQERDARPLRLTPGDAGTDRGAAVRGAAGSFTSRGHLPIFRARTGDIANRTERRDYEDRSFPQDAEVPAQGLPPHPPQGPGVRHQQDEPALQGTAGLSSAPGIVAAAPEGAVFVCGPWRVARFSSAHRAPMLTGRCWPRGTADEDARPGRGRPGATRRARRGAARPRSSEEHTSEPQS